MLWCALYVLPFWAMIAILFTVVCSAVRCSTILYFERYSVCYRALCHARRPKISYQTTKHTIVQSRHTQNTARSQIRLLMTHFCARARRACALRALRLLLADGVPTVGREKIFWCVSQVFFYENGHNSGTKSQKIVSNVGNELSLWGLQTGLWPKLGSFTSWL